jgi:hypothetical protein
MAKYINPSGKCRRAAPIRDKDIKSEGVIQRARNRPRLRMQTAGSNIVGLVVA